MSTDTSEKGLETIIEKQLVDVCGYRQSYSADYERDLCINKCLLFEFIKQTQPTAFDTIVKRGEEIDSSPPIMKGKKSENEFNELDAIINDFNTRLGLIIGQTMIK